MHQFSSLLINEDVLDVSVTQTYDVANCGHKREKLANNSESAANWSFYRERQFVVVV